MEIFNKKEEKHIEIFMNTQECNSNNVQQTFAIFGIQSENARPRISK